jgi:hypothetical protein
MSNWLEDGGDWGQIEARPARDYTPIPKGAYEMEVVKLDVKGIDNANAVGTALKIELRVWDGEYKNRKVFGSHIVDYRRKDGDTAKAETVQNIGRAAVKALCEACGKVAKPKNWSALEGSLVKAHVSINTYGADKQDNQVDTYSRSVGLQPVVTGEDVPWR